MLVTEVISLDEATNVWSRAGGKQTRKFRCTSGPRKGRVMSSPASCNKPMDISKSAKLKQTKLKKPGQIKFKTGRTRRTNPASVRLTSLNKPKTPKTRGRRIR